MTTMTKTLCGLAVLAAVGCGGSSGGDFGSVAGTVHGSAVEITDAISASVTTTSSQGVTVHSAFIVMANAADLCADATANTAHPNEKGVIMSLFDVNGLTFTTPTGPGMYSIYQSGSPPAKSAVFSVSASDATCKTIATSSAKASTGSVTLTSVSGNDFTGSFDVALDSGDHITGQFTPQECPALQALIDNTMMSSCR
jgi:hypothetical protein